MTPLLDRVPSKQCLDTFRGDRCERSLGHEEPHRLAEHTWAARDIPIPEWRRLGQFRRDLTEVPA